VEEVEKWKSGKSESGVSVEVEEVRQVKMATALLIDLST
jgi:ribosomal protein S7